MYIRFNSGLSGLGVVQKQRRLFQSQLKPIGLQNYAVIFEQVLSILILLILPSPEQQTCQAASAPYSSPGCAYICARGLAAIARDPLSLAELPPCNTPQSSRIHDLTSFLDRIDTLLFKYNPSCHLTREPR